MLKNRGLTSISQRKLLIRCEPSREMGCLTPVFPQPDSTCAGALETKTFDGVMNMIEPLRNRLELDVRRLGGAT
ncbi:MAG TPA: hypothetical protein VKE70_21565 [Candidatus Solibacter sp.]|nr:hypothetical protein [Candidatus Solibacter sp.]